VTARLTRRPGGAARLRALLDSGQTIVAPGAFDPLSARLVEEAGFPAVYMTGFGTSAALIGRPDVGLLTMTEMAGNAGRIAACVDIPVIADADTGYGNPLNVIRTVGAYEAAGVAGIHRIVIFPLSALLAATGAMRRILQEIAQAGTPTAAMQELPTFAEFVDFIGLPQVHAAEQRYAVKAAAPGPGTGGADGSDV
jgi:2-methylisocitrate lyase-like PEP mutase family enzyme